MKKEDSNYFDSELDSFEDTTTSTLNRTTGTGFNSSRNEAVQLQE